ncbi:MAG: DUF2878 domain-containing protein [Desulfocapsaceae bacterium]
MNIIINFIIYQVVWLLCVFEENQGALIALLFLAGHLLLSPIRKEDLKLMGFLLVVGVVVDGALNHTGYISYNVAALPIPFWLAVIWLALATLPHHSLKWLKNRYLLSAFFGAIGGPLAYWAGVKAGAASFVWPLVPSLILLALTWALLWPMVMYVAGRAVAR